MRNLKDCEIPSRQYEKFIYEYLNKHYDKNDNSKSIATELFFKFSKKDENAKFYHYPSCVYYAMVEWWKLGFYDIYFNRDKTIDKSTLQWNLILKELLQ